MWHNLAICFGYPLLSGANDYHSHRYLRKREFSPAIHARCVFAYKIFDFLDAKID